MISFLRGPRALAFLLPLGLMAASPAVAQLAPAVQPPQVPAPATQEVPGFAPLPAPTGIDREDPWIYHGTDIPVDKEWLFGKLPNGLRYAVRRNGVPPEQVSIRIRIDTGSLYERENERGFAHLMEHLSFRESKYLKNAAAIPTWQRLGATFGSDTNAETTATQTVYKLDLPNAHRAALEESVKLLSGMIREPVLNDQTLSAELPIVLSEMREGSGPQQRIADATRTTFFDGQLLADRPVIGTTETLRGATPAAVQAFHDRWYRPENTVIVAAGDTDPEQLAALIERYFGDWKVPGKPAPQPDFGKPALPQGADPENPVGKTAVLIQPDAPRAASWAVLRPWEQVTDNLEYNRGLLIDAVAQAIINRRLEARARAGGSYLVASVDQQDVSRSVDATFVSVTPLTDNWQAAVTDVRGVIADALAMPPTQEEIDREVTQFDTVFANLVEQETIQAGSKLADDVVNAVDIRESVAAPATILDVFRGMKARFTPDAVFAHTKSLFEGPVTRGLLVLPSDGDGAEAKLKQALLAPAEADGSSRLAAQEIKFEDLPPIGTPAPPVTREPLGLLDIEKLTFANGVRALIWKTTNEPGRATVRVRFGSGYRGFTPDQAPYIQLGEMALVSSGEGTLGEEELDRISTGRKLGFDFHITDGVFVFDGVTRPADVADQLYLFAKKLADPRWDANPVLRALAAQKLSYASYDASPSGVLSRDLQWLVHDKDGRFATPTPAALDKVTPESFRKVWEPLLSQGPVEVMVFGDIDTEATVAALSRTFGALKPRADIPPAALARTERFPKTGGDPVVLHHRGNKNQAAAVVAWPTGAGADGIRESRRLEMLAQIMSNRLLDSVREGMGASYAPQVGSQWPLDITSGGQLIAFSQLPPQALSAFFAEADATARDLAINGPKPDELARVTEPMKQMLNRLITGHTFWMGQLEGASFDPQRATALRGLFVDYTEVTAADIQALAQKYLKEGGSWRLAIVPEGVNPKF
ncbi:MAG TPA: insulinase family protein [Croceibacterium sp.]|nr:insulinase family protein [Croceibacterium sp.]